MTVVLTLYQHNFCLHVFVVLQFRAKTSQNVMTKWFLIWFIMLPTSKRLGRSLAWGNKKILGPQNELLEKQQWFFLKFHLRVVTMFRNNKAVGNSQFIAFSFRSSSLLPLSALIRGLVLLVFYATLMSKYRVQALVETGRLNKPKHHDT